MVAIECSTEMKFEAKKEESELKELLHRVTVEEANEPGTFISDIRNIKAKIEAIETEKYKASLIRTRAEIYTAGQMPTKRALADEKSHAKRNEISQIEFNGAVTEEQHQIQLAFFFNIAKTLSLTKSLKQVSTAFSSRNFLS
ncbi:hypothetical protein HPB48_010014 [Haemaphysalis longicornis]|uniref:Uncharacterized protein n=1 Tax=Haemaphysalis longicornis TaxID=44386 RepID=A0A9J6GE05_HAELO|nr:hypothetical protein HPB48_010014 [Haemaphysalis longicornis]